MIDPKGIDQKEPSALRSHRVIRMQKPSLVIALSFAFGLFGQDTTIHTTAPLVVLPTHVTDRSGRFISGLASADFVLFDNSIRKRVNVDLVDSGLSPIALVVLVQTGGSSLSAVTKIRKVGAMIPEAVLGDNGEVAVIAFDSEVRVLQDFTRNAEAVADVFTDLKPSDSGSARLIDAVHSSLSMLAARPGPRRPAILILGESRDRGSKAKFSDLQKSLQTTGVTVYGMHYSTYLTPFTVQPEDYDPGTGNLWNGVTDVARLGKQNTLETLTRSTGGLDLSFETKSKLEKDLLRVAGDIHNRYLVSFVPDVDKTQSFHQLVLQIKNRSDAVVLTRPGYWGVPQESADK